MIPYKGLATDKVHDGIIVEKFILEENVILNNF